MLLQCTSSLFATIVLHAHLRGLTDIVCFSLAVTVFSLWFHSTQDPTVLVFDKLFAHAYFLYTAFFLIKRRSAIVIFLVGILFSYYQMWNAPTREQQLTHHFGMHLYVLVGSHFYVWDDSKRKNN